MAKKYNTSLDFFETDTKVRVYPFMTPQEFARLSPQLKQDLVGKKPPNGQ